jgi:protein-tyrosine-phosphatase
LLLLGHPVRWRLLTELAESDRRVRELVGLVGQPQNLVSYHLARMRAHQLVSMRRSAADGRDSYYSLDLARCAGLLAAAGGAIHPALRLAPPSRPAGAGGARVLFLCTGNSARSQMAEALLHQLAAGTAEACSAGSHPKPLHRNAVRVMRERGIDLEGARPKPISELARRRFDYVITLCDRVREVCPEFPEHPRRMHWSMPDPGAGGGSARETYPAFRRTAAELETRIGFLLHRIADTPLHKEVH